MKTDNVVIQIAAQGTGELRAQAIVQGELVAEFACPISDERDQRSDVAELAARAFDAALGHVRKAGTETAKAILFGREHGADASTIARRDSTHPLEVGDRVIVHWNPHADRLYGEPARSARESAWRRARGEGPAPYAIVREVSVIHGLTYRVTFHLGIGDRDAWFEPEELTLTPH